MEYRQAFETICQLLPHELVVKRVKRGSSHRLRIVKGTHVLFDYAYGKELTEIDYMFILAQIIRDGLDK